AAQLFGLLSYGQPPFNMLAQVGGTRMLRGYHRGRFRTNNVLAAQLEYRFPIVWRFSGAAFAATGEAFDRVGELDDEALLWSIGGGVRFRVVQNDRINVRADVGWSPDDWGFLFQIGEAF